AHGLDLRAWSREGLSQTRQRYCFGTVQRFHAPSLRGKGPRAKSGMSRLAHDRCHGSANAIWLPLPNLRLHSGPTGVSLATPTGSSVTAGSKSSVFPAAENLPVSPAKTPLPSRFTAVICVYARANSQRNPVGFSRARSFFISFDSDRTWIA